MGHGAEGKIRIASIEFNGKEAESRIQEKSIKIEFFQVLDTGY